MQVEPVYESICPRMAFEKNLTISSAQIVKFDGIRIERNAKPELPTSELMRELVEYISIEGRITGREISTPEHIKARNCAANFPTSFLFENSELE